METNLEKNPLKGQALIALAAAAGAIVASRLSRTGLALTAGLALHLWNSRMARPAPVQAAQPEEASAPSTRAAAPVTPQEEANQPPELLPEAGPIIEPAAVLPVPAPIEDTHSPAWDDLRAALAPSLETISEESPPGPAAPEAESAPEAGESAAPFSPLKPILTDFQPFPPTQPWIESTEPVPPPAFAEQALSEPDQPDFLIESEELPPTPAEANPTPPSAPGTTTLPPRPVLPPNIIARPESGNQPSPVTMTSIPGLMMPSSEEGVGSGEASHSGIEEKKNFFNWLRS
jgi:hypothetical protein